MRERQAETIGASRTEKGGPIPALNYGRGLIVPFAAAWLMAFVGAFRTDVLPFAPRLAYWLILMMTGAAIGIGATAGVRHWGRLSARPAIEGALISLLIAAPLTAAAMGANLLFFRGAAPGPERIAAVFVMVLTITAAVVATIQAFARLRPADGEAGAGVAVAPSGLPAEAGGVARPEEDKPAVAAPRLLERLPPRLRGAELHAIQAEDHYLRVYTSAGSDLVLLRMADALLELGGVGGARTHRSWWVARSAVTRFRRANGRAELTLEGDIVAPVSRSYLPVLQREGWFG